MEAGKVAPIVSTEWLAAHLDDAKVRVIDGRWYLSGKDARREYEQAHLPGAIFMDLGHEMSAPPSAARGRHPLPEPADFQTAARRAGIRANTHVVVYDDMAGAIAARLWWVLRYFGHERVSVLDGGLTRWQAEGRPLSDQAVPSPSPGDFVARPHPQMVADLDEVRARSQEPGFLLLDARDPSRYRGEQEPIDPRAGHIPGARNAPYAANLADGCFKSPEALQAQYAALGADQATTIVAYCGSGVTAAHDLLALEMAGYQARLFPGSWSQWSSQPDLPIVTGEAPGERAVKGSLPESDVIGEV
jgi:thiosulfate/3-mercaptopyruvate sulfurtransferase